LIRNYRSESLTYQTKAGIEIFGGAGKLPFNDSASSWPITASSKDRLSIVLDQGPGPYLPTWQSCPFLPAYTNFNYLRLQISNDYVPSEPLLAYSTSRAVTSAFQQVSPARPKDYPVTPGSYYAGFISTKAGREVYYEGDPVSDIYLPIYKSFDDNTTVAILLAVLHWSSYFTDLLPTNARDISVVLHDSCTRPSTYFVRGNKVVYGGPEDIHEASFEKFAITSSWDSVDVIEDGTESGLSYLSSHCPPSIKIYPTTNYYHQFNNKQPIYMTLTVAMVFTFTTLVFIAYDRLVQRRQDLVLTKALQSGAIVTSLFPQSIAERLMKQQQTEEKNNWNTKSNQRLRSFVSNRETNILGSTVPIADLFPNATVSFADIAGFTAWSSTREPTQVFVLLQNLYQAFDHIANQRKVFKVETIGDCYVAVTGCPEIQDQHAVIMARFATDCQRKMKEVTSNLSLSLGPDTNGK
jgi:Adenylate and Guanylate cyclase catalytic domain